MLLIDSHVHVYPSYRLPAFFSAFRARMKAAGAQEGALMLAERAGTDVFSRWEQGLELPDGERMVRAETGGHLLRHGEQGDIAVIAGRQVVCAERIEVLALGMREEIPDGLPAATVIERIVRADGLPVLAWGVGKWLFSRASVVDRLLRRFEPDELFLGDSSLRPWLWEEPLPMVRARSLGRRVLHGSDPLAPAFEEQRVGQYADLADTSLGEDRPLRERLLCILRTDALQCVGHRSGPFQFLRRQFGAR